MQVTAWSTKDRERVVNPEMNFKTLKGSTHEVFGHSGVHNNTPEMIRENDGINPTVDFKELLGGVNDEPVGQPEESQDETPDEGDGN